MRVLLSTYGSRGTEFIAAQVDTDAATAQGCAAPVLGGVMTEGVWR